MDLFEAAPWFWITIHAAFGLLVLGTITAVIRRAWFERWLNTPEKPRHD